MVEEVASRIYRIEVPLPIPQLDSMNAYVIIGTDRTLVVDPGMAHSKCFEVVKSALQELEVDPEATDFFMTHQHGDHFGLVTRLLTESSTIYLNRREAEVVHRIRTGRIITDVAHFLALVGFPEQDPVRIIPPGTGVEYTMRDVWPFRFVEDGDTLDVGQYHFTCLHTPGHSAGHTCLYDPDSRILFSGDHVLQDITPSIQLRSDSENPLQAYLDSLKRLSSLEIGLVLPGHRAVFRDCRQRIEELIEHHHQRAKEILAAVNGNCRTAYEVASQIQWSVVSPEGWKGLPLVQQFFATGEAFSHLKYLEERGEVGKEHDGEVLRYFLERR